MREPGRVLHFSALLNVRDLGGCPTTDGSRTRWRTLMRADDLAQLTAGGTEALSRVGLQTILDLRWPQEIAQNPSSVGSKIQGIRYEHIPLLTETAKEWRIRCGSLRPEIWACKALECVPECIGRVLRLIGASTSGPLLFHCVAGKDRTGVIAALLLILADVVPEIVVEDYRMSEINLREPYLARYQGDPAEIVDAVRCPAECIHNMYEYLAHAGGIRAYLRMTGLDECEIQSLRSRLRD